MLNISTTGIVMLVFCNSEKGHVKEFKCKISSNFIFNLIEEKYRTTMKLLENCPCSL